MRQYAIHLLVGGTVPDILCRLFFYLLLLLFLPIVYMTFVYLITFNMFDGIHFHASLPLSISTITIGLILVYARTKLSSDTIVPHLTSE